MVKNIALFKLCLHSAYCLLHVFACRKLIRLFFLLKLINYSIFMQPQKLDYLNLVRKYYLHMAQYYNV